MYNWPNFNLKYYKPVISILCCQPTVNVQYYKLVISILCYKPNISVYEEDAKMVIAKPLVGCESNVMKILS